MLELIICSLLTILPDYLYRRYVQGKRLGKEITFYSVWFELRWGITGCLMLTISLITTVFFFHPATDNAGVFYRTVPIMPVGVAGRVVEVNFPYSAAVKQGDVLFRLDSAKQEAAVETAKRKIAEIDASLSSAQSDVVKADAQVGEAKANYQQAKDELDVKSELQRRNPGIVPQRDIEKLQVLVDQRQSGVDAANAVKESAVLRVSTLLPAQKASAEAAMQEAEVELDKTYVRAGFDGRVEQFMLRTGDVVNQMLRPAGVLIPEGAGQGRLQAGFGQIEASVMRKGMLAEAACVSKPWTIIPLVVTDVQDYIAAGQIQAGQQLIDLQAIAKPGTILAFLEPLYKDGLDGVVAGSVCTVNAYTNNHEKIADKNTSTGRKIVLHVIDGVGFVHALLLRIHAILMPFKNLVLGGHS